MPDDLIFKVEKNDNDSISEDTMEQVSDIEVFKEEKSSEKSFEVEKSDNEVDDDMKEIEETVSPLKKTRVLPGWMTKNKGYYYFKFAHCNKL